MDGHQLLRLAKANLHIVRVIKETIDKYWPSGLDAEGKIACGRHHMPRLGEDELESVSWEFVLKGSPWEAPQTRIGQSRQLVTHILDAMLCNGWTAVTGLEISRSVNKKSALLFKRCSPRENSRHACLSPLGKQKYQLINAPPSLHRLVREEFRDVLMHERQSDHQSVCEMTFSGRPWWVINPDQERDGYIFIRKRMGRLLESLAEAGWRLVASASVARLTHEDKDIVSGDIHSWFLLYSGAVSPDGEPVTKAAEPRVARLRKEWSDEQPSSRSRTELTTGDGHGQKGKRSTSAIPRSINGITKQTRVISPPPAANGKPSARKEAQRSQSGNDILGGKDARQHPSRFKLTNAMKSQSIGGL